MVKSLIIYFQTSIGAATGTSPMCKHACSMIRNMKENNDTIAAICSGMTSSGINIIRISGDSAFDLADKIFRSISGKHISDMGNFSVNYGYIVDNSSDENSFQSTIDEVLLLKMKSPHSYTKEDVIEIDCHGGIFVTKKILNIVLSNGARLAEPGEFTKRAYLNGRIDLSQAEAVIDIINSKNNLALKNSVRQLKGQVKDRINDLRELLISDTAYIEAALDDPEHISLEGFTEKLKEDIVKVSKELKKLIDSYDDGRLLNEGINTCILGLPNAGKSSLLNALLNEDRAIVTDIAGTTRDVLKETVTYGDIVLNIFDTAGIRDTEDVIEKIGVDKAKKEAENADLILYVVDLNIGLDKKDIEIINELKNKKIIIVYNKCDLKEKNSENEILFLKPESEQPNSPIDNLDNAGEILNTVTISSLTHCGIDELISMIKNLFYSGSINTEEDVIISNERHKELLTASKSSVDNVLSGIDNGLSEDFLTIDLMDAYIYLGRIIGESLEDDLADRIFKDFCMGK